ncbi:MAG: hypothetical protein ACP5O4_06690, partial [bacterium]
YYLPIFGFIFIVFFNKNLIPFIVYAIGITFAYSYYEYINNMGLYFPLILFFIVLLYVLPIYFMAKYFKGIFEITNLNYFLLSYKRLNFSFYAILLTYFVWVLLIFFEKNYLGNKGFYGCNIFSILVNIGVPLFFIYILVSIVYSFILVIIGFYNWQKSIK